MKWFRWLVVISGINMDPKYRIYIYIYICVCVCVCGVCVCMCVNVCVCVYHNILVIRLN